MWFAPLAQAHPKMPCIYTSTQKGIYKIKPNFHWQPELTIYVSEIGGLFGVDLKWPCLSHTFSKMLYVILIYMHRLVIYNILGL